MWMTEHATKVDGILTVLTFVTSGLTLGRGSSTALQGLTHLVLLGSFLASSFIEAWRSHYNEGRPHSTSGASRLASS